MFQLRFHLGAGKHFLHWQIKEINSSSKFAIYFDPQKYSLLLDDCTLISHTTAANKIYRGQTNRQPCGYVKFKEFQPQLLTELLPYSKSQISRQTRKRVYYNPKFRPYWYDAWGHNINNYKCDRAITFKNRVFTFSKN